MSYSNERLPTVGMPTSNFASNLIVPSVIEPLSPLLHSSAFHSSAALIGNESSAGVIVRPAQCLSVQNDSVQTIALAVALIATVLPPPSDPNAHDSPLHLSSR